MGKQTNLCQFILVINPGSTSTKIALYRENKQVFLKIIRHPAADLMGFDKITKQFSFRKDIILQELQTAKIPLRTITAVIGRGGMIKPVPSGVYVVSEKMVDDLATCRYGDHASNLGGLIAYDLAENLPNAKAFIADPVVVDEFDDVARITGHPLFERKSILHTLNQKAVARLYSATHGKIYEELNIIVAHMGGGVTVGAHCKGRIIDVNQGLDGEGPFSPERTGTLPVGDLVRLCYSGEYTKEEVLKMINGKGGYMAYLGTNSAMEVRERAMNGDEKAALIQDALCYQVAKEIGAMSTVLNGEINAILLTGGLAYSDIIISKIKNRILHLAPIFVYPGEDEMQALALNVLRVLKGEVAASVYEGDEVSY
jgi:butyrate kinase